MSDHLTHTGSPRSQTNAAIDPGLAPPSYELLEEIGRGGMGVVYRARDLRLGREVAVKLLLGGAGDSVATIRFRAEAHITGRLQHPGIPAVHELGALPDGRPFLAMKLVKGQTLQKLLKDRPDIGHDRGRMLAVFEALCQAVGYAHAHGVIHRDLKPNNVMVGAFGEVQVMDWGLAKVLSESGTACDQGASDTDATVAYTPFETPATDGSATRTGSVLGTPAYMPPEQAGGEIKKLDARSDVFGLGAILCQMLIGRPPYQGKDANELRIQAVRGDMSEARQALDECGAEPALVDLCQRCLAFRQEERPANGQAVADAVVAIRQQAEARARQAERERAEAMVREAEQRKHRRVVQWSAAAVAAVLLIGLAASLWQMNRAIRAEGQASVNERQAIENAQAAQRNAKQARDERDAKDVALRAESLAKEHAEKAAVSEKEAREKETQERKYAEAITSFVKDDFLALTSVEGQDRFGGDGLDRNATLLDLLNRAAEKLSQRKDLDPRTEAELCWIVGVNYRGAGEAAKGVPFLKRAVELRRRELGADDPVTLRAMNSLAVCYASAGKLDLALPLYEETLRLKKAKLGADHPDMLPNMSNLATGYEQAGKLDLALPLYEETLKLSKAKLGVNHPDTLSSMNNLASVYQAAGKLDLALPLFKETVKRSKAKLGADHPHTLIHMNSLASCYQAAGKLEEAFPLYEETLELTKVKLGADHPDTLRAMNDVASSYYSSGNLERALQLFEESLNLMRAKLGADHPDTLQTMNNLAHVYRATGNLDRALPMLEENLKLTKARLGEDHPQTLMSMGTLAWGYNDAGKLDLALPLYEETLKHRKSKLGDEHPDTLASMNNLASGYRDAGKPDLALPLYEKTVRLLKANLGVDHPYTLGSMDSMASAYKVVGKLDLALPLFQAAAMGIEKCQYQHERAGQIVNNLINCHEQLKQFNEAETWRRKWLAVVKERSGAGSIPYANELAALGSNLLRQHKLTEAETSLKESLAIRQKKEPDAWTTFDTQSMLGVALAGQKKYAAAEPHLLAGYEGMKAREETIPLSSKPRLTEAVEQLVQLYEALDRKDEMEKWFKELAKRKNVPQEH